MIFFNSLKIQMPMKLQSNLDVFNLLFQRGGLHVCTDHFFKLYIYLCLLYCLEDLKKLLFCSSEQSQTLFACLYSRSQVLFGGPRCMQLCLVVIQQEVTYLTILYLIEISVHFSLAYKVAVLSEIVLGVQSHNFTSKLLLEIAKNRR